MSVLARPSVGLVGLLFDGELSLVLSPLPCVSVNGARSAVFFRENVSSNDVVGLGMCIDFGRSFDIGRFGGEDWPASKKSRCFCAEWFCGLYRLASSRLRFKSLSGTLLVAVTSCKGCELNSAHMGVLGGSDARAGAKGAVFSLSLLGDCGIFLGLLLPNMDARLVEDFIFFDLSWAASSSCECLESTDCFSLLLSLPRDRSDTVLRVFLCKPFLGLELRLSCDCLRWGGGRIGRFSI